MSGSTESRVSADMVSDIINSFGMLLHDHNALHSGAPIGPKRPFRRERCWIRLISRWSAEAGHPGTVGRGAFAPAGAWGGPSKRKESRVCGIAMRDVAKRYPPNASAILMWCFVLVRVRQDSEAVLIMVPVRRRTVLHESCGHKKR